MKRSNSTSVFNNHGFTLIEILIAITLLGFISIGIISVTQNAADTMERTTELNENNLQIETALSRFEWDFSQIYSPLYFSTPYQIPSDQNSDGKDDRSGETLDKSQLQTSNPLLQEYYQNLIQRFERNEHFSGISKETLPIPRFYSPEKTIFEFFTSSNRRKVQNIKQSHFAWVRYSLEDAGSPNPDEEVSPLIPPGLKSFVRYFSADDPYNEKRLDPEDAERVKGAVLLENVEKLEFQFWDMERKRWEDSLRSVRGGENILRGVKLLVTWYDSAGHKRSVERIFRNHWPMVVPDDQVQKTTTTGTTAGTTAGTATGNTDGGDDGEENED